MRIEHIKSMGKVVILHADPERTDIAFIKNTTKKLEELGYEVIPAFQTNRDLVRLGGSDNV